MAVQDGRLESYCRACRVVMPQRSLWAKGLPHCSVPDLALMCDDRAESAAHIRKTQFCADTAR